MFMLSSELREALRVVRWACALSVRARAGAAAVASAAAQKVDATPVTAVDLAIQAGVLTYLHRLFPDDTILAEESSSTLKSTPWLAPQVRELLLADGADFDAHTAAVQAAARSLVKKPPLAVRNGNNDTSAALCAALDAGVGVAGGGGGGDAGRRRWTLDPLDGTRGYVTGGQFAVALALLVGDGSNDRVSLGVIGAPVLPAGATGGDFGGGGGGGIAYAVEGEGAWELPLRFPEGDAERAAAARRLNVRLDAPLPMVEAVNENNTNFAASAALTALLSSSIGNAFGAQPPARMDSCVKYVTVARGHAAAFVKLPPTPYTEKIVEEAGGCVTDGYGRPLRFDVAAELEHNAGGLIVCPAVAHRAFVEAVAQVREAFDVAR